MYMEENGGVNCSGVTVVKSDEACVGSYQVAPRSETTTYFPSITAVRPVPVVSVTLPCTEVMKKKRGRPRKYGPDGSITMALSPMPISASIPLSGDVPAWKHSGTPPVESFKKKQKFEVESQGEREADSVGANFTPHVITVNAGEDVAQKIISFAQQGSRAICVLAANGAISNVTLRQPNSSGGTLTYEGPFEILSLTGSFMLSDNGVTKSRSGGMSVSLSASDGRVMGGGLAGMLIAAGPVQVVVGSFVPGHQQEQKPKKQRIEHATAFAVIPATPVSEEQINGAYTSPSLNFASSTSFPGNNMVSVNSIQGSRI